MLMDFLNIPKKKIRRSEIVWLGGLTMGEWYDMQSDKPKYMLDLSLWDEDGAIGTIWKDGELIRDMGNGFGIGTFEGDFAFGRPWDRTWKDYVTGYPPLVINGEICTARVDDRVQYDRRNKSVVGEDEENLVFVTGRGHDVEELKVICRDAGLINAINNDGGGSARCLVDGVAINNPTDDRPSVNALAIYMKDDGEHPEPDPEPERKFKVCLDPGHGTGEPNCSPDKRYLEYKFAYDQAQRIKELLEWTGRFEVLITKETEEATPGLSTRANIANRWGADIYLSIHSNAVSGGWNDTVSGLTAWIYAPGGKRQELAERLLKYYGEGGVELFGSKLYAANFAVLARTNMPAVLVENLFHTCHGDVDMLLDDEYRDKLAYAAACGVCEYFGLGVNLLPDDDDEKVMDEIRHYTVQVGAFCDEDRAEDMLELLDGYGLDGFIKKVS